jgi:hypothetical protein
MADAALPKLGAVKKVSGPVVVATNMAGACADGAVQTPEQAAMGPSAARWEGCQAACGRRGTRGHAGVTAAVRPLARWPPPRRTLAATPENEAVGLPVHRLAGSLGLLARPRRALHAPHAACCTPPRRRRASRAHAAAGVRQNACWRKP